MNDNSVRLRTPNVQSRLLKEVDTREKREPECLGADVTEVRRGGEAHQAVLVCGAVGCFVVHRKPVEIV